MNFWILFIGLLILTRGIIRLCIQTDRLGLGLGILQVLAGSAICTIQFFSSVAGALILLGALSGPFIVYWSRSSTGPRFRKWGNPFEKEKSNQQPDGPPEK